MNLTSYMGSLICKIGEDYSITATWKVGILQSI